MTKGTKFEKHLFEELEDLGFGKWAHSDDLREMAALMIAHIDKKRAALGIALELERVLWVEDHISEEDRYEVVMFTRSGRVGKDI